MESTASLTPESEMVGDWPDLALFLVCDGLILCVDTSKRMPSKS